MVGCTVWETKQAMRRRAIFGRSAAWYKHAQVFGQVVGGKFEEGIGNRIRASFASGWGQNFTINMCWQIAILFFRLHCLVRFHCLWSHHKSKESMLCSAGCSMQSLVGWLWMAMRGGMSCAKCTRSRRQLRKFARLAPGRIFFSKRQFRFAARIADSNSWPGFAAFSDPYEHWSKHFTSMPSRTRKRPEQTWENMLRKFCEHISRQSLWFRHAREHVRWFPLETQFAQFCRN